MTQFEAEFTRRCRGAILGTAFGDALGLPVEGMTADQIFQQHGVVNDYLPFAAGVGRYSDDTQMTLATGISLVRRKGLEGRDCAQSCAELFEYDRGYGRSAETVLSALKRGHDYQETGKLLFPEGSFGNGAAMRIAPIGLMYGHLPAEELRSKVTEAVLSTHVHEEALDGAHLVALFIGRMSRAHSAVIVDFEQLSESLFVCCKSSIMRAKFTLVRSLLAGNVEDRVAREQIGCGVRSSESVMMALYLAIRYITQPEMAVINAVQCGGDTDTIAAIVGAMVGTRHGDQGFPERWHARFERGAAGYDALVVMAEALAVTTVKKGFFIDFYL